jgi:hypothetical protein
LKSAAPPHPTLHEPTRSVQMTEYSDGNYISNNHCVENTPTIEEKHDDDTNLLLKHMTNRKLLSNTGVRNIGEPNNHKSPVNNPDDGIVLNGITYYKG